MEKGEKSIRRIILEDLLAFLVFLAVLAAGAYLEKYIPFKFYHSLLYFFINNLHLSLIIAIASILSELFWVFSFPIMLLAPVFSAALGVLLFTYMLRFWYFIDSYLNTQAFIPVSLIYVCIIFLTLIIGYLAVLGRIIKQNKSKTQEKESTEEKEKIDVKQEKKTLQHPKVSWQDIWEAFKFSLYSSFAKQKKNQKQKQAKKLLKQDN
ncbi:MAG: hypothetical protein ACP5OG_06115 [Candidatus Nanoarchaeia archaeon]